MSDRFLRDWIYAFFAGASFGALFLLLRLTVGDLPGGFAPPDGFLFCVMTGVGFAVAAMSLVWWEDRKQRMSLSKITSTGWLLGEWVFTTVWIVIVLSVPLSGAAYFYSGDWPVTVMAVAFAPLSAVLTAYLVSRNSELKQENSPWKET